MSHAQTWIWVVLFPFGAAAWRCHAGPGSVAAVWCQHARSLRRQLKHTAVCHWWVTVTPVLSEGYITCSKEEVELEVSIYFDCETTWFVFPISLSLALSLSPSLPLSLPGVMVLIVLGAVILVVAVFGDYGACNESSGALTVVRPEQTSSCSHAAASHNRLHK